MLHKYVPLPLTRYGLREIVAMPLLFFGAAGIVGLFLPTTWPWGLAVASVLTLLGWAFFRDFERVPPVEANVLLSPADGKVTDILEVEEPDFIGGPAWRIGIFLSIFDVHVNRAPCTGKVAFIREKPGKCLNALRFAAASEQNQATSLALECPDHPAGRVLVRQITGAIARRIICAVAIGDKLSGGQRYGMIKFGSRTELFLPRAENAQLTVKQGDTVCAGRTVLVRYAAADRTSDGPEKT